MGRKGLAARIAATVALLLVGGLPWLAPVPGDWQMRWDTGPVAGSVVLSPVSDRVPLPEGLRAGDVVDTTAMSVRDRLVSGNPSVAPGTALVLPLAESPGREGVRDRVEVRAVADDDLSGRYPWREWPFLLLALLLVWKGRDRVAWGVALLLAGVGMLAPVLWAPLASPWNLPQRLFVEYVVRLMAAFGALMVLLGLLGHHAPRLSRAIKLTHVALFALYYVDRLGRDLPWILHGQTTWGEPFRPSIPVILAFLANFLVLATLTSRRIDAASRLRARWVLLGIALYVISVLDAVLLRSQHLWLVPYTLSLLALAYATLRHKLVPTTFAISRTVVYGVVVALIVGAFAVVEDLVSSLAIGRNAGLALQLGVPLVLGILFHRIHGKVEPLVERVFFRQRFEAEARLDRLAHESAYIAHPGPLVARALRDVSLALRTPGVALYWHARDGGYRRRGQTADGAWPRRVDEDDPAFVTLRAGQPWVLLQASASPLGTGGIAFPMSVAGRLLGAIVCGERASQYAPDERRQMARVASAVGTALHALSARASEEAMEALLAGQLSLEEARRRLDGARGRATKAAGRSRVRRTRSD